METLHDKTEQTNDLSWSALDAYVATSMLKINKNNVSETTYRTKASKSLFEHFLKLLFNLHHIYTSTGDYDSTQSIIISA
jgi:hypothetical protein